MKHAAAPTRSQVIHGYLVLPHAAPIVVVLAATAAFALVAARGWPGWGLGRSEAWFYAVLDDVGLVSTRQR